MKDGATTESSSEQKSDKKSPKSTCGALHINAQLRTQDAQALTVEKGERHSCSRIDRQAAASQDEAEENDAT